MSATDFGFEAAEEQINQLKKNVPKAQLELKRFTEEARDLVKSIAESKGLRVTGDGIEGIQIEGFTDRFVVGWATRPNFHLYFHEIGFHALDNRHGKQFIQRSSRGRRERYYRAGQATYVPPRPHMRPAFYQKAPELGRRIQSKLASE